MGHPHRIGIVGLGSISGTYLETLTSTNEVEITAVADLNRDLAEAAAASLPSARVLTTNELVAADEVDAVLNLTLPAAHAEVSLAAIAQGKDVYSEKPLAADLAAAQEIIDAADAAGIRLGCAPDTVLGTGIQTARAVVDAGEIGMPLAATAMMVTPGHERWHPRADFYYQPGGGPLLDMGPYYVTALVQLLGPVVSVIGASSRMRSERILGTGPREGQAIPVEVETHVSGVLTHASGVLSTLTTSFEGTVSAAPPIEVHGVDGSLVAPDPNQFTGDTVLHRLNADGPVLIDLRAGYRTLRRGAGLLDLLRTPAGTDSRASGAMGLHVLEIMTRLLESAESGSRSAIQSTVERPALVPLS